LLKKILIVEDEEDILEILSEEFLSLERYEVFTARDGEEALHIAGTHSPDIMILDIQLPKLNGYEVCMSVKTNPSTSGTRIIMISGRAQFSDRHKALQLGADDYITKPFDLRTIVKRVNELLSL
jgi:DNA-binding response OmpR family regulator